MRGYRRYGFSDRERQRIFSDFAKDELYEEDEIEEDEEIARQFPGWRRLTRRMSMTRNEDTGDA